MIGFLRFFFEKKRKDLDFHVEVEQLINIGDTGLDSVPETEPELSK